MYNRMIDRLSFEWYVLLIPNPQRRVNKQSSSGYSWSPPPYSVLSQKIYVYKIFLHVHAMHIVHIIIGDFAVVVTAMVSFHFGTAAHAPSKSGRLTRIQKAVELIDFDALGRSIPF